MRKWFYILGLILGMSSFSSLGAEEFPEQWVLGKYVKNGKVTTGNPQALLNVRSGPDVSHDAVRTLKDGQPVTVYAAKGDWIRISPDAPKPPVAAAPKAAAADPASAPAAAPKQAATPETSEENTQMVQYSIIASGILALLVLVFIQSKND